MNSFDVRLERAVHEFVLAHPWLGDVARVITHVGDPLAVTTTAVVVAVVLVASGRRRAALYVLVVRAVAVLADTALKHAVGRARPVFAHPIATAAGSSFPSGHAFGSAALWGSVALLLAAPRGLRVATAAVVPIIVATTRVVLGVHYVTDVVVGLLLGWAVALGGAAALGAAQPAPLALRRPRR